MVSDNERIEIATVTNKNVSDVLILKFYTTSTPRSLPIPMLTRHMLDATCEFQPLAQSECNDGGKDNEIF